VDEPPNREAALGAMDFKRRGGGGVDGNGAEPRDCYLAVGGVAEDGHLQALNEDGAAGAVRFSSQGGQGPDMDVLGHGCSPLVM
jgi:hypothetical protein